MGRGEGGDETFEVGRDSELVTGQARFLRYQSGKSRLGKSFFLALSATTTPATAEALRHFRLGQRALIRPEKTPRASRGFRSRRVVELRQHVLLLRIVDRIVHAEVDPLLGRASGFVHELRA